MAMDCKRCGSKLNDVTHTYQKEGVYRGKTITVIRRRRRCRHCGFCWHTTEHFEDPEDRQAPKKVQEEDPESKTKDKTKPKGKKGNPYLPDA